MLFVVRRNLFFVYYNIGNWYKDCNFKKIRMCYN